MNEIELKEESTTEELGKNPLEIIVEDYEFKLKQLKDMAQENHINNFKTIMEKCGNNLKCVEEKINLLKDAMDQLVEDIDKENQEKNNSKINKNR